VPSIKIDGLNIVYELRGEGTPLVFVHGLGGSRNVWNAQLAAFSVNYRVLTFDLPGAGQSDPDPAGYSIPRWAAQIDALTRALGITDRIVLVGHSMATVTAVKFALDYPDRVAALVLAGMLAGPAPGLVERAEKVEAEGLLSVVDAVLAGQLTVGTREGSPAITGLFRAALAANNPASYCGHCRALENFSVKDDLGRIKCPTLIVVGDQDTVTPLKASAGYKAAIGSAARLAVIADAAHTLQIERHREFNAAVFEFLSGL
jgi:3-oxoadipate enol-lactonase